MEQGLTTAHAVLTVASLQRRALLLTQTGRGRSLPLLSRLWSKENTNLVLTFLPPEAPKLAWLGLMEEGSGQQGLTQPKCPRAGRSTASAATLVLAGGGGGRALCWLDLDPLGYRA